MYKNLRARRIFVCHSRHTNLKETVHIGEIFTSFICSDMLANYYFNLLQVSCLLQNVCTSNFCNLILLPSISLFLRHRISSFFLFISYLLTEISPLFKSCLIVRLQSFCDGFGNFANRTHVQKTAMRMIITL